MGEWSKSENVLQLYNPKEKTVKAERKEKKGPGVRGWKIWVGFVMLAFVSFVALVVASCIGFVLGDIVFKVSIFFGIVLVVLALFVVSALLGVTIVKEMTAKAVLKAGQFHKILVQQRGMTVDRYGNIVPGREWHPLGGIRWYGFWPLYSIYRYRFSWVGVKPDGTFVPHEPEVLDHILLKDDVYGLRVEGAEDNEKVPLDMDITLTVQIVNPYRALFGVQNWFETLVNRLVPYVRDFVTNHTYREMIETDIRLDREIVNRLAEEGIIGYCGHPPKPEDVPEGIDPDGGGEFLERYGVLVRKLEVRDINPQAAYREATLKAFRAKQEAEGRIEENFGVLVRMLALATNQEPKDIGQYLMDNPAERERFMRVAEDLLHRRIAIDSGAFMDIRVQGATGVEQALLNMAAVWQRMPDGSGEQPQGKKRGDMSIEEKRGVLAKRRAELGTGKPPAPSKTP